jgi:hypothetical protein
MFPKSEPEGNPTHDKEKEIKEGAEIPFNIDQQAQTKPFRY